MGSILFIYYYYYLLLSLLFLSLCWSNEANVHLIASAGACFVAPVFCFSGHVLQQWHTLSSGGSYEASHAIDYM